jgi:glycosyltransferase involved in cell wall biosynthesis
MVKDFLLMKIFYFLDDLKKHKYSKDGYIYNFLKQISTRYGIKKRKYDKSIYKDEHIDLNLLSFKIKTSILKADLNLDKITYNGHPFKNLIHNVLSFPLTFNIDKKSIIHSFNTKDIYKTFKKVIKVVEPLDLKDHLYSSVYAKKKELTYYIKDLNSANYVIANSDYIKNVLIEDLFVDEDKIKVIPRAIDSSFFEDKKINLDDYKLPSNFFIFTGKILRYKNLESLIRFFNNNEDLNFVIAGSFDTKQDLYKDSLAYFNYLKSISNENIKFISYVSKDILSEILKKAIALIEPSIINDFPENVIEAQASKIPTIVSYIKPHYETLKNTSIYFNLNSMEDLKEKIKLLKETKDEYIEKGIKNSNKYTWDKVSKMYLDFYKTISV